MAQPRRASEHCRRASETGNATSNLTVRYGKIGIPAVAAALRYCDAGKNPAYAPVVPLANRPS